MIGIQWVVDMGRRASMGYIERSNLYTSILSSTCGKCFLWKRASDWNAIAPKYMGIFSRVGHFFCCSVMARTIEDKKLGAATMFDIVCTRLFSNESD